MGKSTFFLKFQTLVLDEVLIKPVHDKTYNKTCVTSKESDEPVHQASMTPILIYPSLDSLDAVEGTCNWQRL